MAIPVADVVAAVLAHSRWPSAFAPESRVQEIQRGARALPAAFEAVGFEVRLAGGEDIDVGAGISAAGGGREILADVSESADESSLMFDSPPWCRVRQFCGRWATAGSPEFDLVTHAFLEFDTSAGLEHLADPSIFLGLPVLGSRRHDLVSCLIVNLLGGEIPGSVRATLQRCAVSLPQGSVILHIGVMLSRSDRLRLHVCVPEDAAMGYLNELGLRDETEEVVAVLLRHGMDNPLATLQLEVGENISNAVGVEFSPPGTDRSDSAVKWETFLDRLTEDGLCKPDRRDALRSWPATYRSPVDVGGWRCKIHQEISHVKLVLRPGLSLEAKAYLSVTPSFQLFGPK